MSDKIHNKKLLSRFDEVASLVAQFSPDYMINRLREVISVTPETHIAVPCDLFEEMVELVSGVIDDEGSETMRKIRKLESEHERD